MQGLTRSCCAGFDVDRTACCMKRMVALQPDFMEQRPHVAEIVEAAGHEFVMLPKFHCEFNYIEMLWSSCKGYTRPRMDGSTNMLREVVLEALASVPLSTIRKYARHTYRYMHIHHAGVDPHSVDFVAKQYSSHRRVSEKQLKDAVAKFNNQQQEEKAARLATRMPAVKRRRKV